MLTRLPFLACLAIAQAVCAQGVHFPSIGGADFTLPVTSIRQARVASTLLQQYDFSCGSAAIATLQGVAEATSTVAQEAQADLKTLAQQASATPAPTPAPAPAPAPEPAPAPAPAPQPAPPAQ